MDKIGWLKETETDCWYKIPNKKDIFLLSVYSEWAGNIRRASSDFYKLKTIDKTIRDTFFIFGDSFDPEEMTEEELFSIKLYKDYATEAYESCKKSIMIIDELYIRDEDDCFENVDVDEFYRKIKKLYEILFKYVEE